MQLRQLTRIGILALLPGLAACPSPVEDLTQESEFIFTGTSQVLNASTIDVDDVTGLAVVRVDQILSAVPAFRHLTGAQVTVRLRDTGAVRVGEQRVFFTRGWHFGESVAVEEVGSVAAPGAAGVERMQADIERFQGEQSDRDLAALLRSAEVVVRGTVVRTAPADVRPMATEHDPMWHEAEIRVAQVLKGSAADSTITIWFPTSTDVTWFRAPRFQPDMEGIWLLRRAEFAGAPLPRLTALTPEEFRPVTDEERVTRLLRAR